MAPSEGETQLSIEALVDEVQAFLRSIRLQEDGGNPPYLSDVIRSLEASFAFDGSELVQLLERYGYLVVDRANGLVGVTRDGGRVAAGDKLADLMGDLLHQYEGRVTVRAARSRRHHEILDGRYRRFGAIGSGALATVYRGEAVSIRREVAIKELREIFSYFTPVQRAEIVRKLERVVAEHARISHPNVVQILDQSTGREYPYFVTELAHGGSIRRLVSAEKPPAPGVVLAYFIQVCHGLKTAHALGIVHRAIKPENVLFDVNGNAKLGDFGLASVVDRPPGQSGHVFIGMGSVGYMAPEQFQDPRQADSRTDIYSLGILLYELCTGRLPGRRSPMPSEVRTDLPKGVDDVFDRMTQDDPDERYPLVEAILDDLYRIDEVVGLLDRRSAVLMHRGAFGELELPPLTYDDAVEEPLPAPDAAPAVSPPPLGAAGPAAEASHAAQEGYTEGAPASSVPAGAPELGQPLPASERTTPVPGMPPLMADPGVGGAPAPGSVDHLGGQDQLGSYGSVDDPGTDSLEGDPPAYGPSGPDRTPEPVMPRRRFGVPPRRK